ncbi:hypothetical protein PCE1_001372 [Barthelona sp. PCE]
MLGDMGENAPDHFIEFIEIFPNHVYIPATVIYYLGLIFVSKEGEYYAASVHFLVFLTFFSMYYLHKSIFAQGLVSFIRGYVITSYVRFNCCYPLIRMSIVGSHHLLMPYGMAWCNLFSYLGTVFYFVLHRMDTVALPIAFVIEHTYRLYMLFRISELLKKCRACMKSFKSFKQRSCEDEILSFFAERTKIQNKTVIEDVVASSTVSLRCSDTELRMMSDILLQDTVGMFYRIRDAPVALLRFKSDRATQFFVKFLMSFFDFFSMNIFILRVQRGFFAMPSICSERIITCSEQKLSFSNLSCTVQADMAREVDVFVALMQYFSAVFASMPNNDVKCSIMLYCSDIITYNDGVIQMVPVRRNEYSELDNGVYFESAYFSNFCDHEELFSVTNISKHVSCLQFREFNKSTFKVLQRKLSLPIRDYLDHVVFDLLKRKSSQDSHNPMRRGEDSSDFDMDVAGFYLARIIKKKRHIIFVQIMVITFRFLFCLPFCMVHFSVFQRVLFFFFFALTIFPSVCNYHSLPLLKSRFFKGFFVSVVPLCFSTILVVLSQCEVRVEVRLAILWFAFTTCLEMQDIALVTGWAMPLMAPEFRAGPVPLLFVSFIGYLVGRIFSGLGERLALTVSETKRYSNLLIMRLNNVNKGFAPSNRLRDFAIVRIPHSYDDDTFCVKLALLRLFFTLKCEEMMAFSLSADQVLITHIECDSLNAPTLELERLIRTYVYGRLLHVTGQVVVKLYHRANETLNELDKGFSVSSELLALLEKHKDTQLTDKCFMMASNIADLRSDYLFTLYPMLLTGQ